MARAGVGAPEGDGEGDDGGEAAAAAIVQTPLARFLTPSVAALVPDADDDEELDE